MGHTQQNGTAKSQKRRSSAGGSKSKKRKLSMKRKISDTDELAVVVPSKKPKAAPVDSRRPPKRKSSKKKGKKTLRKVKKVTKKITRRRTKNPVPTQDNSGNALMPLTKENKRKVPKEALIFYCWEEDDEYVKEILEGRGWTFGGEPVDKGREDYPDSLILAKDRGDFNTGSRGAPCLYWADDGDSRVLGGVNPNHLISSICNADKSLTKVKQQGMFNEMPWFPECFTLPKQKAEIESHLRELQAKDETNYWICKPRDSYGGFGMCVFKGGSEGFMKQLDRKTTFVIQRYMHNPYLFAGKYKFHFRCYMVVTNVKPLRAYLWKNAQIQFATHEFDLNQIEKSFNKYSHITNYKVNNEKKNRVKLIEDKPGIGMGSEWSISSFIKYMNENEPRFDEKKFWDDLEKIARVVSFKLMNSRPVQRGLRAKKNKGWGCYPESHFEIYGLDVLMNADLELALTEANTQPGLDWTDPVMPNGIFNPEIVKANDITVGIVNDTLTLIGIDDSTKPLMSPFIQLHPVE